MPGGGKGRPLGSRREALRRESSAWPSWTLTPHQACDLELLLNGGFSPLEGFLGRDDYDRVCREMRLADGTLWPIPVVLDLPEKFAASLSLLMTGLSGSGKSTIANIRRIGFVASEIAKNGGIAICAPIAPFDAIRKEVRAMVSAVGGFALVFVDVPLEVCEARDRKGLYAKARAGQIPVFTGISDPYEVPEDAEVVLKTAELSPEEAAQRVILHLEKEGYVRA